MLHAIMKEIKKFYHKSTPSHHIVHDTVIEVYISEDMMPF